jgi:hypothetical protein
VTVETRFWSKVNKNGAEARPGLGPCWLWTAGTFKNPQGFRYGAFWLNHLGQNIQAHRFSLELSTGLSVPDDLCVCHHCDVPLCVNPAHLFLGTNGDNIRDASRKGRMRNQFTGVTHCQRGHELTPSNVRIRIRRGRECRVCRKCQKMHHDAYTEMRFQKRGWTRKKPRHDNQ